MLRNLCSLLAFLAAAATVPGAAATAPATGGMPDARAARVQADGIAIDDPYLGAESWQFANPRFLEAWELGTGSPGTIVAVLDTGIDADHEDLGTIAPGYDFVNDDSDPHDDNGHGTAVAGIIAGQGGNGKGVAGVCWGCTIMPVKVLGAGNSGSWKDVATGIEWATDHGAKVINMSFGLKTGSATVAAAVKYAQSHQVVLVASAGNGDSSTPNYPAVYDGVISAAAVDQAGNRYSVSNGNVSGGWGSNYGSWVDVDAPGCIATTWPGADSQPEGRYTYFCGTSAAAPFVSGLAGLALSRTPSASSDQVIASIEAAGQAASASSTHGLIDASGTLGTLEALPPDTDAVRASGKISTRLSKRAFKRSQARRVKLFYRFSNASSSFGYRLERKTANGWKAVRGVTRHGNFRGTHALTIKQLFGGAQVAPGRYRLILRADANQARVLFVAR